MSTSFSAAIVIYNDQRTVSINFLSPSDDTLTGFEFTIGLSIPEATALSVTLLQLLRAAEPIENRPVVAVDRVVMPLDTRR